MSHENLIAQPKVLPFRPMDRPLPSARTDSDVHRSNSDVVRLLPARNAGSVKGMQTRAQKFGVIRIILQPDGSHQYVRDGAYASSSNLTIQALSEVIADLATKGLEHK